MKQFFRACGKTLSSFSPNEYAVLLVVLTGFIHIYAQAAAIILLPFYALITGQIRLCLPKKKYGYLFLLFAVIALVCTFVFAQDIHLDEFHKPIYNAADSSVQNVNISAVYLKGLSVLIVGLFFDLHFFTNVMTKKCTLAAMKLSAWMSVPVFAVALVQTLTHNWTTPDRAGRVPSVFSNENYYGTVLEFLILIVVFLFLREKSKKKKIAYAALFVLNAAGLYFSGCRTAVVCVGAGLLIFLTLYRGKYFPIYAGVLLLCAATLYFIYPSIYVRTYDFGHDLDYRFGIWKTALEEFSHHVFYGGGFYSYNSVWMHYNNGAYFSIHAHNLYLDTLLNFGVVGFLSLFGFFGFTLTDLFRNQVKNHYKVELALCAGILVTVLLHGLTDVTLIWTQTASLPALILLCPDVYAEPNAEKETK